MKKVRLSVLVLFVGGLLFQCQDLGDRAAGIEQSLYGTWKLSKKMEIVDGLGADKFNTLQNCVKDNLIIYDQARTYTETEGSTKCNASDSDTVTKATWELLEDGSKLKLNLTAGRMVTYEIMGLTEIRLEILLTEQSVKTLFTYTRVQ